MDENKSAAATAAPETTEKGKSKRWIICVLLGFALVLLVSCVFLFTLRVGNRRYLCAGGVDARAQ